MRVYQVKDYDAMSRKAANVISAQVIILFHVILLVLL